MKKFILFIVFTVCLLSQTIDEKIYLDIKEQTNKTENIILIKEYFSFLSQFPTSEYQKHANFELAEIFYKEEEYHQALIFYLRTAILYRGYETDAITLKIKSIVENFEEKEYEASLGDVWSSINYVSTGNLIDDLLHYLKILDSLYNHFMFDAVVLNSELFIRLFPESINSDIVFMIMAKAYHQNKNFQEAILYYNRVNTFFEDSELRDDAIFSAAQILEKDLSLYSEAIKEYEKLYQSHSSSEYAPKSLFHIGYIYETELESNLDAIKYYSTLFDKYPSDSVSVSGLFRIANLYEEKNSFDLAIETYEKVLAVYPEHSKTPDAQMNIISAYNDHINDIVKSIEEMKKFAKLFPEHSEAGYYLFEAAELYYEKLKNMDEAKALYKEIIAKYNGSSYAEKAEDRLNELN